MTAPGVRELVAVSRRIGAGVPYWTQGAGGNLSWKDRTADRLWIKASGIRLDRVGEGDGMGLACVLLSALRDRVANARGDAADAEVTYARWLTELAESGRPSMESGFHAVLNKEYVAHFHSLVAVLVAGRGLAEFTDDLRDLLARISHQV